MNIGIPRSVLVTGGAGFIGIALADQLAEEVDRWVAFDNLHPQVHAGGRRPAGLSDHAELLVADVTDELAWDHLLGSFRPDVIVHLAAETGTAQSLHEATRHAHVNVVGTTTMLDALGRAGHVPSHFVLSSSRAVYGEGQWEDSSGTRFSPGQRSHAQLERGEWDFPGAHPVPSVASSTPPAPTSIYGATKLTQEHILRAWAGAHDSQVSTLRFQNVYGPGQSLINSYTGIVSLFSQQARRGEHIPIYEDGRITRDFVYIDDVAKALAAVIVHGPWSGNPVWDVGSGIGTTILELATHIADYFGAPSPTINGAYRDGDVRHAECDITQTLSALDWSPQVNLEQGLARLQAWITSEIGTTGLR